VIDEDCASLQVRWWSENKLPWWLTEMAAAAAVEGGHGG